MKIGVFDSGLGGLIITKSFLRELGDYDYLYFGDTKNLPYGDKISSEVLMLSIRAVEFLIKNNCKIIIFACNTASSIALRYVQQIYIPQYYPNIKVLGVIVPTVEEAIASSKKKIGVTATNSTINSHIYNIEIKKINPDIKVQELATPKLVPAIENDDFILADSLVQDYVKSFSNIDSIILGCTHYPLLKECFRKYLPEKVQVISQDEFMGEKLKKYLHNHPEIETKLTKNAEREFLVSQKNKYYEAVAGKIISGIKIKEVKI
ncbi:MAG: glutamate racemase [Lactobacillaceae bacterium]|nr:glutamate racemase [Lactobacillaceae bacterium]